MVKQYPGVLSSEKKQTAWAHWAKIQGREYRFWVLTLKQLSQLKQWELNLVQSFVVQVRYFCNLHSWVTSRSLLLFMYMRPDIHNRIYLILLKSEFLLEFCRMQPGSPKSEHKHKHQNRYVTPSPCAPTWQHLLLPLCHSIDSYK